MLHHMDIVCCIPVIHYVFYAYMSRIVVWSFISKVVNSGAGICGTCKSIWQLGPRCSDWTRARDRQSDSRANM
jgi:hypothetical protein